MDRFQVIASFAKVVESGSFARAADRLGASVSAISRQVADLEAHLGVRLLNRTTRRLSLTESGRGFYERCVQLLADLEEAEEAVASTSVAPRGTLRLTASVSFGCGYLAAAIADFRELHPQLRFDVTLSDLAVDLVDEGLDLAIRIGDIGSQALIGRRVGVSQLVCCAAPSYVERHPAPSTPADLAAHHCLTYEYSTIGNQWRYTDAAGTAHEVRVSGPVHANSGAMLAALAVAGVGIILEPDFIVAADVRAGRLVRLLPDYTPPSMRIYAAYPSRRHLSAKVRTFVDFLAARFERDPGWRLSPPQ
ncbi:MAG: LysR family transcriptional regulator [Betaproteobacteria bacterium]|nr:LysR family transcriptional regulator [Betaproteobacteria bacterium]MDE2208205.1 LysR family transcriptional regulator [Betaproteobacteria bacterium]MDE2358694.1 LysR family transcriptional regulator [Betaproteobacteria bacterium]